MALTLNKFGDHSHDIDDAPPVPSDTPIDQLFHLLYTKEFGKRKDIVSQPTAIELFAIAEDEHSYSGSRDQRITAFLKDIGRDPSAERIKNPVDEDDPPASSSSSVDAAFKNFFTTQPALPFTTGQFPASGLFITNDTQNSLVSEEDLVDGSDGSTILSCHVIDTQEEGHVHQLEEWASKNRKRCVVPGCTFSLCIQCKEVWHASRDNRCGACKRQQMDESNARHRAKTAENRLARLSGEASPSKKRKGEEGLVPLPPSSVSTGESDSDSDRKHKKHKRHNKKECKDKDKSKKKKRRERTEKKHRQQKEKRVYTVDGNVCSHTDIEVRETLRGYLPTCLDCGWRRCRTCTGHVWYPPVSARTKTPQYFCMHCTRIESNKAKYQGLSWTCKHCKRSLPVRSLMYDTLDIPDGHVCQACFVAIEAEQEAAEAAAALARRLTQ